ncbi:hypothetical protein PoB_004917100 [Plakobranchus ocellatus]|uniref:Uncharacterized protein n=1 Tax=Plakobranchus ocellatus TaxID=259542 RepID=A0AAV4BUD1_9GAST|nr:hypothetical protein PoB_004917100 [Plakobranchus ocellatus]
MDETSFLDDTSKDPDFLPNYKEDSNDSAFDTNDSPVDENKITDEMRPEENKEMKTEDSRHPSAFPVEGEPRENVSESGTPRKRKRPKTEREIRKERRNKGCEYTTESGKKMPRKSVGVRCKSSRCRDREFYCHELTEQDRIEINVGFFRSGQLSTNETFLPVMLTVKKQQRKKKAVERTKQ